MPVRSCRSLSGAEVHPRVLTAGWPKRQAERVADGIAEDAVAGLRGTGGAGRPGGQDNRLSGVQIVNPNIQVQHGVVWVRPGGWGPRIGLLERQLAHPRL